MIHYHISHRIPGTGNISYLGWVVSFIGFSFFFPIIGDLTNIFEMGWFNHQLEVSARCDIAILDSLSSHRVHGTGTFPYYIIYHTKSTKCR